MSKRFVAASALFIVALMLLMPPFRLGDRLEYRVDSERLAIQILFVLAAAGGALVLAKR